MINYEPFAAGLVSLVSVLDAEGMEEEIGRYLGAIQSSVTGYDEDALEKAVQVQASLKGPERADEILRLFGYDLPLALLHLPGTPYNRPVASLEKIRGGYLLVDGDLYAVDKAFRTDNTLGVPVFSLDAVHPEGPSLKKWELRLIATDPRELSK